MKVLHLIGGGDIGGAKSHVHSLVRQLGNYIDVKIISFRPGMFADEARAMGIDIEVVKSGNIISDIRKVIRIIREEGYDIVHSHGAKANMVSVIVKRFVHLPSVTTVHSDYRLDYLQSYSKKLTFGLINTFALRLIDYYISVSKTFKEMLVERGFNPERIFTIYNGIDINQHIPQLPRQEFIKKYKLDISESDVIVGILARLDPVKGLGTLLDAASMVLEKNRGVKFLICGEGEERKNLERKTQSLGITGNVFFMGHINEPNDAISNFDINVLTSISESFPYAILEPARLKKATISSNVGAIPDLIESGKNGFLFNPGDAAALSEYLLKFIEDSKLREEMGEKLYEKTRDKFSLESMCKTQLEIYNNIISQNSHKRFYDVMVSGYYGHENSGDDAILMAIINNLRSYKEDIKITVLSKRPWSTKKTYKVDSINRFNLLKIMMTMKSCKLFINGGGSLIQDLTSTRSLMYYLVTIWLAKHLGLKVMIYANGIGPINRSANRLLTKSIVDKVDIITLRDDASLHELKTLGIINPRIKVTADPVFALHSNLSSKEDIDKILAKEGIVCKGPFLGISVREWEGSSYGTTIAEMADYMADKYGVKPVFIPMQYPRDLPITHNIVSKMKNKAYIIENMYGVALTLGIMQRMEMLVSVRLHALIYAASLAVPMVGIVYEPKVEAFLKSTGQASAGHLEELDTNSLIQTVDRVWTDRSTIREHLESIRSGLQKKALESAKIAVDVINGQEQP